jgi:hypothetical protein
MAASRERETMFDKNAAPAAPTVDAQTVPVAAQVGGSQEAQSSESDRKYTTKEVEAIVKDRLARDRKKVAAAEKPVTEAPLKAGTANLEEEFKLRTKQWETEKSQLSEKLSKFQTQSLRSTVEKKLSEMGCLDPEIVFDNFHSRGLVKSDEDGQVVVENLSNSLDDLCRDYLAQKPHLVRATASGGVGSKAPKDFQTVGDLSQIKNWTPEQYNAWKTSQGINKEQKNKLF